MKTKWKHVIILTAAGVLIIASMIVRFIYVDKYESTSDSNSQLVPSDRAEIDKASVSTCASTDTVPTVTTPSSVDNDDDDGLLQPRILYRHPWAVRIEFTLAQNVVSYCGGSLIDSQHVLTAAGCVPSELVNDRGFADLGTIDPRFRVRFEDPDIDKFFREGSARLSAGFVHRAYRGVFSSSMTSQDRQQQQRYDVALLQLKESLSTLPAWGVTIQPVCLPAYHAELTPKTCRVVGWQTTLTTNNNNNKSNSTNLSRKTHTKVYFQKFNELTVTLYNKKQCLASNPSGNEPRNSISSSSSNKINNDSTSNVLCWGLSSGDIAEGVQHACVAGGPLVCETEQGEKKERLLQLGIVAAPAPPLAEASGSKPRSTAAVSCAGESQEFRMSASVPSYRPWLSYVALPALGNAMKTSRHLRCLRIQCWFLLVNVSDVTWCQIEADAWAAIEAYLCPLRAAHVFCLENEVKPARCQQSVVPELQVFRSVRTRRRPLSELRVDRARFLCFFDVVRTSELIGPGFCEEKWVQEWDKSDREKDGTA